VKLKASLAIDAQQEEIAMMERAITGHRPRIAAGGEAIADLEKRIEEANRHIQELMKI
jgi:ParB-like chromosome segregation protein Spo0J